MKTSRVAPREFNSIASAATLIGDWYGREEMCAKSFKVSHEGNINFEGISAGTFSHIFVPADADFRASLEPVVRPLVLILVERCNLVTYTSCGGHLYKDHTPAAECHVGVLPRSRSELCYAWRAFKSAAKRVSESMAVSRPRIFPWYLTDELTKRSVPVIDLYLGRNNDVKPANYSRRVAFDALRMSDALAFEFRP